jgi:hypothetical protein
LAACGASAGKAAATAGLAAAVLSSSASVSPAKAGIIQDILNLLGIHRGGGNGNGHGHGQPNCFCEGTPIRTPQGEVRIEELRVGDLVTTMRGEAVPIKWIGRNIYRKSGSTWPSRVVPIRVSRFAMDGKTPYTDLYLSPQHALFIDGSLLPVRYLVNGTSIVPATPSDTETVQYLQIVLDTHEVIWAAGVAAETFVASDKASWEVFDNFAEYERLYPADSYQITPLIPEVNIGGRAHLQALLSVGLSRFVEIQNPLAGADCAYDRIAMRARELELV